MARRWEKQVTDPDERKVFEALADPAWDFRTIDGLKKVTKLSGEQLETILTRYKDDMIRESPVRDKEGRRLFTLTTKAHSLGEVLSVIRSSVTKSSTSP
jgi:hypothetical protein